MHVFTSFSYVSSIFSVRILGADNQKILNVKAYLILVMVLCNLVNKVGIKLNY